MDNPLISIIIAFEDEGLNDIWRIIENSYSNEPYETLVNYFIEAVKYGMEQRLIWPYQEIFDDKIIYEGTGAQFAEMLRAYMPETYAELKEIHSIVHFLQFDFPYHDTLKPYPFGEGMNYKMSHVSTFTQKEWKVIEKLTTVTFKQPTAKGLLNSCEALLGGITDFEALQTLKNWFYLCTEASLFWPQATEQGFSPAPKSTVWLDNIIALLKQYKTADQIPQEAIEYPYIQWFVEEKPIEWVKFELKGRLKIMD